MQRLFALLALFAGQALFAVDPKPADGYHARRAELRKALDDGLIVLFGRTESAEEDLRTGFFQEPNFYYLTGWSEPGTVLILAPLPEDKTAPGYADLAALPRELLFIPRRDAKQEIWTGRKAGPEDENTARLTGFAKVLPAETMESELRKLLEYYPRLYTLSKERTATKLQALAPLRPIADASKAIAKLRMKKSPEELGLIQKAVDVSIQAHRAAWKRAAPGLYEYQIAATMAAVYFERGCERHAYAPIVGAGPNSTVLHYSRNSRRMDGGELLLMDVGAECSGYAADITRTIPVRAKFSKRQREIYNVVLGAQKAVIAAVKPGATIGYESSLQKIAKDYINTHGTDLHGNPLGKYYTHSVSHHIGLEVHDASEPQPLEPGMVITVEPGIYIPEENIGVRIEDMVLVTENGAKVLSAALPREVEEIERALAQ